MQNIKKAVFAYIDGFVYSNAVCDYAVFVAKELNMPLVLLNTIKHGNISSNTDLSGNIGLGEREDLLEELSKEDSIKSKKLIKEGKELLEKLKQKAMDKGLSEVFISQRHGELYENLKEIEDKIRVAILPIDQERTAKSEIGSLIEDIIIDIDAPIILVNKEFSPIKNVLIAYNADEGSSKALKEVSNSPMLGKDINRFIVNVNSDIKRSENIIEEAKKIMNESSSNYKFISMQGDTLKNILTCKEDNDIDMLAIGSFSHTKLKRAIFGSFTEKLIQNIDIPLIVLK